MWLRDILKGLRLGSHPRAHRRRPGQRRPRLSVEFLEDRAVPAFLTPIDYAAGPLPLATVLGHLNADTTLDLAAIDNLTNTMSVLFGAGDGAFQAAQSYATGQGPQSLAVGDIDNDGDNDVVTANTGDLSVLLNNGNGTFQPAQSLGTSSYPQSVSVGDFDNDGNMDLAVTSFLGDYEDFVFGYASVLLGDGAGSFATASTYSLNSGPPLGTAVADLDGDGNLDLVTANYGASASVLLGDGAGGFSSISDFITGRNPTVSVAVGDVDGDSDLDLATANSWGDDVSVLLGDGTGSFGTAQNFNAGSNPHSIALGDFNDDGVLDLVTANNSGMNVSVLIGKGDGAFNNPLFTGIAHYPLSVAVGELNGGGLDVVVASGNYTSGIVSVLLNAGDFPDANAPSITIGSDVTISEGNLGTKVVSFTVSLSANPTKTLEVSYTTADGSARASEGDYVGKAGVLIFSPGGTLTQTIQVTVNGDRRAEANETFFVNLGNPINGIIARSQAMGTIVDDEPRISINDVTKAEGKNRQTTLFTFTVTLASAYDEAVNLSFRTVDAAATSGSGDYVARTGTLTFAPGETTKTITIEVKGDNRKEANETFYLDLFDNGSNSLFTKNRGIGTILNDD